ncbi:MAG TPA: ABC transporter substrate-binding protein [Gemmatimonadaceae bacterium]|nr:ABC transporter substrate-binding protein [Gemmatimonadaceae bacterium]
MRRALVPLLLVAAAACSGREATQPVARVVCVSKQLNEFMYAIGAQNVMVGRDLTSIYPPEIRTLTSVGYHRALSAEGIISLRPTLFLTDGNYGPAEVTEQLEKVGIPILTLKSGPQPDSAMGIMAALGRRFHREAAADSIIKVWKAGMDSVLKDTLKWAGVKKPRVLIMHFGQIVNDYLGVKGGVAGNILHWAGGVNALDSASGGMLRLTPEIIAKIAPDVIIATDVGFDRLGSEAAFAKMPGVNLTPAAKHGRIYRIFETDVMYYGPRTPAAIRRMEAFLHPDLVKQ